MGRGRSSAEAHAQLRAVGEPFALLVAAGAAHRTIEAQLAIVKEDAPERGATVAHRIVRRRIVLPPNQRIVVRRPGRRCIVGELAQVDLQHLGHGGVLVARRGGRRGGLLALG